MKPRIQVKVSFALFVAAILVGPAAVQAARPPAAQLLPRDTFVYVRLSDTQDIYKRFKETAMGRMVEDPQLKALVTQLYGSASQAFSEVGKQLDMTLDELVSIPQGEIALAVVLGERPAFVGLIDVRDKEASADKLLKRMAEAFAQEGATQGEETIGETKFTTFDFPGPGPQRLIHGLRDGTLVFSSSNDLAKGLLDRWDGKSEASLADNENFAAIMKSCRPSQDEDVQITWFVDPMIAARMAAQANPLVLAFFPTLGLDGVKGLGGTFSLSIGEFDQVSHIHILLDQPRAGIVDMLALGSGDTAPERWVPGDVANYATIYWDFADTHRKLAKLLDSFQGEGATARMIKNFGEQRLGVDIEADIIPALDGRVTYVNRVEAPGQIDGQGTLVAVKVKDPAAFADVVAKIATRFENRLEKKTFGGSTYYAVNVGEAPAPGEPVPQRPCFGVVDKYVMASDRTSLLEKVIAAQFDSSIKPLSESIEFKLISSKIGRLSGDARPGMVSFQRPEEGLRFVYRLATSQSNRDALKRQSENNPLFSALNSALENNPLPPFETLAKYLAPGGGVLLNDETGFHYTDFVLKRNTTP